MPKVFFTRFATLFLLILSFDLLARELPNFVDLVEQNSPAVVNISTTQKVAAHPWGGMDIPEHTPFGEFFKHFFGEEGGMQPPLEDATSLGSGFILSADGYVITNHHVIEDAEEILVRLSDKRELKAKVIGSDKYTDIALLKLDADDLPVVKIGNSDKIKVGEWVLAIGSPFGFDHSVTAGIVSAKGRSLPKANYVPFIQTDVAINPGNSGGPLFNLNGEVIGINSQIYSRTGGFMGLSFAIPVKVAMDVVEQIKHKGKVSRGWLGVYIQEITLELAQSFGLEKPVGALVSQVIAGSPAEKYGIKAGDVILSFNGHTIMDSASLPPLVGRVPVGSKAKVDLFRDGKQKTINVVIEQLPEDDTPVISSRPEMSSNRLGIEVSDLDQQEISELGKGVRIERVAPGSVGYDAGLKKDDIILQMNRENIKNTADFRKKVAKLPTGRMIPVLVHRQGSDQFIGLKIPSDK
ncbi:MAG: DegQ family serine endoprotease [Gammaproteobacteria bacterium]|nr:DegQ family serine endoprotease [Gammaproteobacteria bacterium]